MTINKIIINNILGIEHLSFEPNKFTVISGMNGEGKTSVIEAIKGALKGGNDATLLRNGESQGEIVLILDGGETIIKKVTPDKSELVFMNEFGRKVNAPQSYLSKLFDILSVNPIAFLTAEKKKRLEALLEILPLRMPEQELLKIKDFVNQKYHIDFKVEGDPLELISDINKLIYDERTAINRVVTEKEQAVAQLKQGFVEEDFSPEQMNSELEVAQKRIEEVRNNFDKHVMKLNEDKIKEIAGINVKYESLKQKLDSTLKETLEPLNETVQSITLKKERIGAMLNTRELIKNFTEQAKLNRSDSEELSTVLKELEQIRQGLFENLPIKDLEIRDGEIYLNGIVFDRVNTAEQIKFALEVAKLRAGEIRLICVDGIERLDSKSFEEFKKASEQSGLQLIVTKVTDSELEIKNQ